MTFSINEVCPALDAAIRLIHTKVFDDQEIAEYQPDWKEQEANAVECYNLAIDEDDDPRNINIPESEGHCEVHGLAVEASKVTQPLKMWTVNIGSEGKPKYAIIGDYWDEEMVRKVTQLLHEYQDLFPTKFFEMKGILGDIGVIKIPLKPDVNPVKQRPYRLNPKYKEKVRMELDKMLAARIIEPIEESKWVSPMVVQEKKTKGEIRICVDLRKLNDACLHDPFPTPFTDEVLDCWRSISVLFY